MKKRFVLMFMLLAMCNVLRATSPESVSDARCLIVAVSLLQSPNNATRAAASSSALYYLGRLDGREPSVDLEKLLVELSKQISPEEVRLEAQRCGQILSLRGKVMSDIGRKLAK
jgi:hypothetical protein